MVRAASPKTPSASRCSSIRIGRGKSGANPCPQKRRFCLPSLTYLTPKRGRGIAQDAPKKQNAHPKDGRWRKDRALQHTDSGIGHIFFFFFFSSWFFFFAHGQTAADFGQSQAQAQIESYRSCSCSSRSGKLACRTRVPGKDGETPPGGATGKGSGMDGSARTVFCRLAARTANMSDADT